MEPAIPRGQKAYWDRDIAQDLSFRQRQDNTALLATYWDILSNLPGFTFTIEHRIQRIHDTPLQDTYPLPHPVQGQLQEGLNKWLKMGIIIELCNSLLCSLSLPVCKKDGTDHFCLDCHQINKITIFDDEPIADRDHIFISLSKARCLSKMDLVSGLWQVGYLLLKPLGNKQHSPIFFNSRSCLLDWRMHQGSSAIWYSSSFLV